VLKLIRSNFKNSSSELVVFPCIFNNLTPFQNQYTFCFKFLRRIGFQ
jgi:hypothetical protein